MSAAYGFSAFQQTYHSSGECLSFSYLLFLGDYWLPGYMIFIDAKRLKDAAGAARP
jgi:hypothetical protein